MQRPELWVNTQIHVVVAAMLPRKCHLLLVLLCYVL